ncbi:MAG: hypothetical protein EXR99_13945 [Gemmataceae bacterium]|nr:hypothetical protein [Gemmataceae bacterium]
MNYFQPLLLFFIWAMPAGAAPPVTALAFSPDGKQILLASQAGIAGFTFPGEKVLPRIPCSLTQVHDLSFSPDGKKLLAAGGSPGEEGSVEMLEWPGGKSLQRFHLHKDLVYRVAWSADGKLWATASGDGTCKVYSAEGQEITRYQGHSRAVLTIAFFPGGKEVASGGMDGTIQIWDARTGKTSRTLDNHLKAVNDLVILAQGSGPPTLVSIGEDRTARLWHPAVGRMVRFVKLSSIPRTAAVAGGQILLGCNDGQVRALDAKSLELPGGKLALGGRIFSLAVSHDGAWVVVGGEGGMKALPLP